MTLKGRPNIFSDRVMKLALPLCFAKISISKRAVPVMIIQLIKRNKIDGKKPPLPVSTGSPSMPAPMEVPTIRKEALRVLILDTVFQGFNILISFSFFFLVIHLALLQFLPLWVGSI